LFLKKDKRIYGSVLGGALGAQYGTHGVDDSFVSKYDPNGNLIWVSQLGVALQNTGGNGITLDSSGNSYATGYTSGSVLGGAQGTQYGAHGTQYGAHGIQDSINLSV
jgi:hypothetical protein